MGAENSVGTEFSNTAKSIPNGDQLSTLYSWDAESNPQSIGAPLTDEQMKWLFEQVIAPYFLAGGYES